jgi:DNA polymerase II
LQFANADVPLSLRYAAATGVGPLLRCRAQVNPAGKVMEIESLSTAWELDPLEPPLRVLELTPDCDPGYAEPQRVIARYERLECALPFNPPRALLVNLRAILLRYDPDLILTDWGDTWLLPRLDELSRAHGLPLPLSRDERPAAHRKARSYFSYGRVVYRGAQVFLFGRWHIDRRNAMLWDDYGLVGVLESARVTGLPVQESARVSPGTGISAIQILTALRDGVLVPWQKQQVEDYHSAAGTFQADQGGLVYQPLAGLHFDVAGVDFVSLYPAIMVHFNISPETLGPPRPGAETVPGLEVAIQSGAKGIVPRALAPLLEKRVALKQRLAGWAAWDPRRQRDKLRSSALKWLLVTCFGYLGYKNARFGRMEAHQAVTAYGREILLRAKEAAEDDGFEVLHLYVDGLWLKQSGYREEGQFKELLAEIERRTGLPVALEGIYRWVVFLSSRVYPNRAVANRYFGVFQDGTIKVRGIEARRHDAPEWVSRTQMEIVQALARPADPREALPEVTRLVRRRLAELSAGQVAVEELIVTQRLSRAVEAYRSPSPAARAAAQLLAQGKTLRPGQSVRFVYVRGEAGVRAWDLGTPPAPGLVDVWMYRKLLLRAAEAVLDPFGWEGVGPIQGKLFNIRASQGKETAF